MSRSHRLLPNITQHSEEKDIIVPGGIRTRNLSKRALADLRLRQRDNHDRPEISLPGEK